MYKVFFKDSCFLLTDDRNSLPTVPDLFRPSSLSEIRAFVLPLLNRRETFTAVVRYPDLQALFAAFCSCFRYVEAAGGVVHQGADILTIERLGMTDLPKGHLEAGETIEACAIREVEEECGIRDLHIELPLHPTWHIYERDDILYLKKTSWYLMSCPPGQALHPQTEEDIEEVNWLPVKRIGDVLPSTYASLRPVFQEVQHLLTTAAISG